MEVTTKKTEAVKDAQPQERVRVVSKFTTIKSFSSVIKRLNETGLTTTTEQKELETILENATAKMLQELN